MIKIGQAKNNLKIIIQDGMPMCSEYDPEKESQRWASRQNVKSYEAIIFIGAGSGYKIAEVASLNVSAKIVVIEPSMRTITLIKSIHGARVEGVNFVNASTSECVFSNSEVQSALMLKYKVMNLLYSHMSNGIKDHEELYNDLLGRTQVGLRKILSLRSVRDINLNLSISSELLSIKHYKHTSSTSMNNKIQLLNELIK